MEGQWEVRREEESKGGKKNKGGLSDSPVTSKQSAEHLPVFHAAERTHDKSPLLPRALPVPSRSLYFFFKCVNEGKSLPARRSWPLPQKAPSIGEGAGKSTLTYHNSWGFSLSPLCLLLFLPHLHLLWVGRGCVGGGGGGVGGSDNVILISKVGEASRKRGQTENSSWNKYFS